MLKKSFFKTVCFFLIMVMVLSISLTNVSTQVSAAPARNLKGTITISIPFDIMKPVFKALADAYMKKNPGVKVVLDEREGKSYTDWLGSQLSGNKPTCDIVVNNTVKQYFSEKKFVDFSQYLNKPNPYTGNKKWVNSLEPLAYAYAEGPNKEIYTVNNETIQTMFYYNKDIFKKVGINPPKDWDELVAISKKIKSKGYIPLAIPGDQDGFWVWSTGWMYRVYADQYWRDKEPLVASLPDDYDYDPDIMDDWKFNPKDISNDQIDRYRYNAIRMAKLIMDNKVSVANPKTTEMMNNFKKMIPQYVQEGFLGTDNKKASEYFIRGKAAMFIGTTDLAVGYEKAMKDAGANRFSLGFFQYPPMKGKYVAVNYTRSVGGASGSYGVVNKTKEQNDLNMDFMMFFISPEGDGVRYSALSANQLNPSGSSLVKNVKMPSKWAELEKMKFMGQADNNPWGNAFARGFKDEQKSVRAFVVNSQAFYKGEITAEQYGVNMQNAIKLAIPRWLRFNKYRSDALNDPTKDPVKK